MHFQPEVDDVFLAGLHLVCDLASVFFFPHSAAKNITVLVFAGVPVQRRRQSVGRHCMFDQREPVAGLFAIDYESDSDAAQETEFPIPWTNDFYRHSCLLPNKNPVRAGEREIRAARW